MSGHEVLIGVTGGVAAYKAATLVSRLVQADYRVSVVMTHSATKLVGPATFAALTGRPVCVELFDGSSSPLGTHIELAEQAELMCVAPATANFLAKSAIGVADDLMTTLYLAFPGPVLMAPAMNSEMWDKPAVQRNVAQLREDPVEIVDPEDGWLSCRKRGVGRMADPDRIFGAIQERLQQQD